MPKISKNKIESIYRQYHKPEYLGLDPLVCVRKFDDDANREVVGLFASALARGQVETIVSKVDGLIELMDDDPASFVKGTSYAEKRNAFKKFKHRFNNGDDVAALLEAVKMMIKKYGSLGTCFNDCLKRSDGQLKDALTLFTDKLNVVLKEDRGTRPGFIPSPSNGSACKRMVLYLRWMIREDDGIDLGVWKDISPSILIVPVDTHIEHIAKTNGWTNRVFVDWRMAEEITAALRKFDPDDPVKFDFSLCHERIVQLRKGGKL